jgi:hypothetical protein
MSHPYRTSSTPTTLGVAAAIQSCSVVLKICSEIALELSLGPEVNFLVKSSLGFQLGMADDLTGIPRRLTVWFRSKVI